jgi:hypothetical protein
MHGFVNFFVAAAVVYGGGNAAEAEAALSDDLVTNFQAGMEDLQWRERSFSIGQIERVRENFVMSFGSCSFTEPLEDMRSMGWIR